MSEDREPREVRIACLCGAVRLVATGPASHAAHCHCDNCRRAHGAGVWTFVTFPADAVRVEAGEERLSAYRSDTEAVRQFCATCGTTLTYASPRWPGTIDLSLANVDGDVGVVPGKHVYADRAPAWAPILDDLPCAGGVDGVTPLD